MGKKTNEIQQLRMKLARTQEECAAARANVMRLSDQILNADAIADQYAREVRKADARYTELAQKYRESLLLSCADALLLTVMAQADCVGQAEQELGGLDAPVDRAERLEATLKQVVRDAKEKKQHALAICQAYSGQYQKHLPKPPQPEAQPPDPTLHQIRKAPR